MTPRRPFTNRYQHLFLGYYLSSYNFRHKAMNCRTYARHDHMRNKSVYDVPKDNYSKTGDFHVDRNYNSFAPLLDYNIKYYK